MRISWISAAALSVFSALAPGQESAEPAGPLWDALGRIPIGEGASVDVFDYPAVRANRGKFAPCGAHRGVVDAWRQFASIVGLPESGFSTVIRTTEKSHKTDVLLVRTYTDPKEIAKAFAAHHRKADGEGPVIRFKSELYPGDPGTVLDAFVEGWLIHANAQPDPLEKVLALCGGKGKSLRELPGARELAGQVPAVSPAWFSYGTTEDWEMLPHRPQAAAGWMEGGEAMSRIDLLLFDTEERAKEAEAAVAELAEKRGLTGWTVERAGRRLKVAVKILPERQRAVARAELKSIRSALDVYELDHAAYPTTEEGLLILGRGGRRPAVLELPFGEAPRDPWDRPYDYRCSEGKIVLRSAGPDGKLDTEDDVVAE